MPLKITFFIVILCLVCARTTAQSRDTLSNEPEKTSGAIILPAIFFSPETSLGFGVAGMYYFRTSTDSLARPSNFQTILIYTLQKQVLITFPYNFFLKKDKWWVKGEWAYYVYPYNFYGIGAKVNLDTYEPYTANYLHLETNALLQAYPDLFIGPTLLFDKYFKIDLEEGGSLQTNQTTGINAGNVFGAGFTVIYDKRNNLFAASGGHYLEARVLQYTNKFVGDYRFTDMYLDVRKYFAPFDKTELGLQFYHQSILGNPPFFNLAQMGGSSQMRGYYDGGYRDNHQTVLQTEIRRYILNRIVLSAFGGLGSVTKEIGKYEKILGSYGVGIRYEMNKNEKLRIRLDYARGANTSGFYININEAF